MGIHILPTSTVLQFKIRHNMYTVHLGILGIIHNSTCTDILTSRWNDCQYISSHLKGADKLEILKIFHIVLFSKHGRHGCFPPYPIGREPYLRLRSFGSELM